MKFKAWLKSSSLTTPAAERAPTPGPFNGIVPMATLPPPGGVMEGAESTSEVHPGERFVLPNFETPGFISAVFQVPHLLGLVIDGRCIGSITGVQTDGHLVADQQAIVSLSALRPENAYPEGHDALANMTKLAEAIGILRGRFGDRVSLSSVGGLVTFDLRGDVEELVHLVQLSEPAEEFN
jgi:hypothetical protein